MLSTRPDHCIGTTVEIAKGWCYMVYGKGATKAFNLNAKQTVRTTRTDHKLSKVRSFVKERWHFAVEENLKAFLMWRNELSTEQSCVIWWTHVSVTTKLRKSGVKRVRQLWPPLLLSSFAFAVVTLPWRKATQLVFTPTWAIQLWVETFAGIAWTLLNWNVLYCTAQWKIGFIFSSM